ncbi:MAG: hypothetical protein C5B55_09170 [Blastocatellia bacterium]|nr:MAG: hypothetical protein C5B55_09170 [Blastocatellia bacterium]
MILITLAMSAVCASAYTLVLRNGRRIEIPNQFVVTGGNLVYEVSPGIQVAVQLAAVDVLATEYANNESPGSFMNHANKTVATGDSNKTSQSGTARRVTNKDLEVYKQRRIASEQAYEQRRKELGLPSVEESRQRAALESEELQQDIRAYQSAEKDTEQYWRNRASALRTETAVLDAQVDYVHNRISETPENSYPYLSPNILPFTGVTSPLISPILRPRMGQRNPVYIPQNSGPFSAQINIGNPRYPGRVYPRRYGQVLYPYPYGTVLNSPWQTDNGYDRSALLMQLDDLLRQRAGLQARWRELEEEAQRAGAYPGWLRP